MKLRILDYISIIIALSVIAAVSVKVYGGNSSARYVEIEASGKNYVYTLDKDRTVKVEGPLGETVIEIKNSRVSVKESPCRNKLCVKAGSIEKAGQWNACMPNKVFIRITGKEDSGNEPDSLSY